MTLKLADAQVYHHFEQWHVAKYDEYPFQNEKDDAISNARLDGFTGALELIFAEAKPFLGLPT